MVDKILHIAVVLSLLVKAVSTVMKNLLPNPSLWFHISGISSGLFVLLGLAWAIVFFHGNNFSRIPRVYKYLLIIAALLAVSASILT